ncbi:MAG: hypothetical protein AAGD96_01540 [Chloroflexota bacterium]
MSFEWQLEEETEPDQFNREPQKRPIRNRPWGLYAAGLTVILAIILYAQWRINRFDQETLVFLQAAVDLQVEAVYSQNGDLYFSNFSSRPTDNYDQMHPDQIAFWLSRPQIVDFEENNQEIWAIAEWTTATGEVRQRNLFFDDFDGSVRLKADTPLYWGKSIPSELPNGTLFIYERDQEFASAIEDRLAPLLRDYCFVEDCENLNVTISPFQILPTTDFVFVSPRIHGLTPDGEIPDSYWQYFDNRVSDLIGEKVVRFAIPDTMLNIFNQLIPEFQATYGTQVELVPYNPVMGNELDILKSVDGMLLEPELSMVTSGAILPIEFYAQGMHTGIHPAHWASAWWNDHMWFLPTDGELMLVSFDASYAAAAGVPAIIDRSWNWEDFSEVMSIYTDNGLRWGIASPDSSILLSRAYSSENDCADFGLGQRCLLAFELTTDGIENALTYYAELGNQISIPPEGTTEQQLNHFVTESSVSVGHTAMWVSRPRLFEHDRTTRNAIVMPFPDSETSPAISPLMVRGGVVSSFSDSPISTWTFINWLSFQPTSPSDRRIPARHSTRWANDYWDALPEPLDTLMERHFETARGVRLGDESYFRPAVLEAIAAGEVTPSQAARSRPPIRWFDAFFEESQQAN